MKFLHKVFVHFSKPFSFQKMEIWTFLTSLAMIGIVKGSKSMQQVQREMCFNIRPIQVQFRGQQEICNSRIHFFINLILLLLWKVQLLPLESLRVLFYERKLPFLGRFIAIWKCQHAVKLLSHSHHTLVLAKEVYNFVLAQGAKKLSASIEM